MTSLRAAVDAMNARKKMSASETTEHSMVITLDGLRLAMIGMDLDLEEVEKASIYVGVCAVNAIGEDGRDPVITIGSSWIDGLLTGLMLAEMRAREEAA